ncbi:hypothetical protein DEO72_LG4g354 [Vigna unguiculata]|uniref:Uncharacterized protein n=1 Tax=Vigna unguiculata TaxID=3917 RepID=A0A4D6LLK6_VIGUN|nr:hypothetical protein DEO72_LG4g354 [Vigna unguiculata]
MAQNVSLKLWLGMGVKHVVFLELWLRMASLELWLRMTSLELWLGLVSVAGVSVRVVARTDGSK